MNHNLSFAGFFRDLIWYFFTVLFLLQNAIAIVIPQISWLDDLLGFLCLGFLLVGILLHSDHDRDLIMMLCCIAAILALGIVCSFLSDIERPLTGQLLDAWTTVKVFVAYVGAALYFKQNSLNERYIRWVTNTIHIIVFTAFFCLLLSCFKDIGMTHGVRYGFPCFQFIYSGPGMFGQYCMQFLFIQSLSGSHDRIHRLSVVLTLVLWASTMRSRAFVVIILYMFLQFYFFHGGRKYLSDHFKRFKKLFRPDRILAAALLVIVVAGGQIEHYFGQETVTARSLLLRYGIVTMVSYFPLGAGLATFGTEAARRFYSPLYYRYNLNNMHKALAENGRELTDCYWPAISAEFGVFGVLLFAILIFFLFRSMMTRCKEKEQFSAVLLYIFYLLISSTATGIFNAYVTLEMLVVFIIIINIKREKTYKKTPDPCDQGNTEGCL